MKPLILIVVAISGALTAMGCATPAAGAVYPPRDDSIMSRLVPTGHTIEPRFPSADAAAVPETKREAGHAFAADRVTILEPSFDEPHSLAWQRDVQQYTADVLNRVGGELPGELSTTARFTVTTDRRDLAALYSMHIALETLLPDGNSVRSDEVVGPFATTAAGNAAVAMVVLAIEALIGAGAVDVVALVREEPAAVTNPVFLTALGLTAAAVLFTAGDVAVGALGALGEQERWSDLYLEALRRHADDVRRALAPPPPPAPPPAAPPASP